MTDPSKKKGARDRRVGWMRSIRLWASYDPQKREVVSFHKFKYQVPIRPGRHVVRLEGHYFPVNK